MTQMTNKIKGLSIGVGELEVGDWFLDEDGDLGVIPGVERVGIPKSTHETLCFYPERRALLLIDNTLKATRIPKICISQG